MGRVDAFTAETPITIKQPQYYDMVFQAAKMELLENAVMADVPNKHIRAMMGHRDEVQIGGYEKDDEE